MYIILVTAIKLSELGEIRTGGIALQRTQTFRTEKKGPPRSWLAPATEWMKIGGSKCVHPCKTLSFSVYTCGHCHQTSALQGVSRPSTPDRMAEATYFFDWAAEVYKQSLLNYQWISLSQPSKSLIFIFFSNTMHNSLDSAPLEKGKYWLWPNCWNPTFNSLTSQQILSGNTKYLENVIVLFYLLVCLFVFKGLILYVWMHVYEFMYMLAICGDQKRVLDPLELQL